MSVCVGVLVWASLHYACHSSATVPPWSTASFHCVCAETGAHSRISAPRRNPFAPGHFRYTNHLHPLHTAVPSPVESPETALHPEHGSCGTWCSAASVCISAQKILTEEVTDLPLSLTIYYIGVWPNIAREWAIHGHIGRCSNACLSEPAVVTGHTECEIHAHM